MDTALKINWNKISQTAIETNNKFHSKKINMGPRDRLKNISTNFLLMIDEAYDNIKAKEYLSKRKTEDKKLKKIQNTVKNDMIDFLKNKHVVACSSYSAGTNLVGDSDLDFQVLVDDLDLDTILQYSNLFGLKGYKYIETRQKDTDGIHHVFSKYEDNVEIEMKLGNKKFFMANLYHVHNYTDNIMDKKEKLKITWAKYNLKKTSKEGYAAFKSLYYEHSAYCAKLKAPLYKIK